jgi:hypothetical protein
VALFDCYQYSTKDDVSVPALLFNKKLATLSSIPGSASCSVAPSPDEQSIWNFNCNDPQVTPLVYSIFNLTTQTTTPLFEDLKIVEQRAFFYVWEFQPSQWIRPGTP